MVFYSIPLWIDRVIRFLRRIVLTESIGPLSMTVGCVQIELTDSYGLCILN